MGYMLTGVVKSVSSGKNKDGLPYVMVTVLDMGLRESLYIGPSQSDLFADFQGLPSGAQVAIPVSISEVRSGGAASAGYRVYVEGKPQRRSAN